MYWPMHQYLPDIDQNSEQSQHFQNRETNVYNNNQRGDQNNHIVSFIKQIEEEVARNYQNLKEIFGNVRNCQPKDITANDLNKFSINSFKTFCQPILEGNRDRSDLRMAIDNVINNVLCSYFISYGEMIQEGVKNGAIKYFLDRIDDKLSGQMMNEEQQNAIWQKKEQILKRRDQELYKKICIIVGKIDNQNENLLKKEKEITKLEESSQNQSQKINALQEQIKKLRDTMRQIQSKNENSITIIRELLQKEGNFTNRLQNLEQELIQLKESIIIREKTIRNFRSNIQLKFKSFVSVQTFFEGESFQNKQTQKKYLVESIYAMIGLPIAKTNLIYDIKRDFQNSFHDKIDDHSNLVILLQTEKTMLCFYYSGKYSSTEIMNKFGMIISLSDFKYYLSKKDNNKSEQFVSLKYNSRDLIIGNREIIINIEKKMVEFVSASKPFCFYNQQVSTDRLFHQQNTEEVKLKDLKIYEIEFHFQNQNISL